MKTHEKAAICLTFVVTSLLGGGFLLWYWLDRGFVPGAIVRTSFFVAAMAAIHVVGFRFYKSQHPASGAVAPRESLLILARPMTQLAPAYQIGRAHV